MEFARRRSSVFMSMGIALLATLDVAAAPFLLVPGDRCDLRTGSVTGTAACLNLDSLDGTTLRVPAATTRISTDGIVICGSQITANTGTDIAYIVDQSSSMVASSFLVDGPDTLVYQSCTYGFGQQVPFRGTRLMLIDSMDWAVAKSQCDLSNDPYLRRAAVVQEAVVLQASLSRGSYAGWVSFSERYHVSDMYNLSNAAAKNQLLQLIKLERMAGTLYRDPLAWARVMLQGGHEAANPQNQKAASPNAHKAIIMISDGEPNDLTTYLDALKPRATVTDTAGKTWIVDADSTPPIYGIFMSQNPLSGQALKTLTQRTGGEFVVIPPNDPDSLKRVMARIVGALLQRPNTDSFRMVNKTNGQVSVGIFGQPEGGGLRIRLDSLVGLQPGRNQLEIRSTQGSSAAKTTKWTVVVSDSASMFSVAGTDSLLTATCTDASRITLRPETDAGRLFADDRDTLLAFHLDVSNVGQVQLSTKFVAVVSKDTGSASKSLARPPATPRIVLDGLLPWRVGSAIRKDAMVQTGTGWDTVRMDYRTPRDARDSAVAALPVLHPKPAKIWFSPGTASGIAGVLQVNLLDSMLVSDTASVVVTHRLGDSLRLMMKRASPTTFQASFSFAQGSRVIQGDGLLQTGLLRQIKLDSLFAVRGTLRDTAVLRAPVPRLRFLDSLGRPSDSLGTTRLDPGGVVRMRLGLVLGDSLLPLSDSLAITLPTWLEALSQRGVPLLGGLRLVGGKADLQVRGVAVGSGGTIGFRDLDRPDTLWGGPISVVPFRLVFVNPSGATSTTWAVDRTMGAAESVSVQVLGINGLCSGCSGGLRLSPGVGLVAGDLTGGVVRLVGGQAHFTIGATRPVDGGLVAMAFDSLSLSLLVQPIRFRAPAPDSAVYEDLDGDGGVDRVRVYFSLPWDPRNRLEFPWPDSNRHLDLTHAIYRPSADSLRLDIALGGSQAIGSTEWIAGPLSAGWAWSSVDSLLPFPVAERVPPVPLRARIHRGVAWDTLVVRASEPLVASSIRPGSDLLRKLAALGVPLSSLPSINVLWTLLDQSLRIWFPAKAIDSIVRPGDSVRFSPGGAVRDSLGAMPGAQARAVVVEGIDHAPFSALVTDADADGRADRITVRFATPPRSVDRFVFRWLDGTGGVDERAVDVSGAVSDSGGRILILSVAPFAFGATACPQNGCIGFATMSNARYGDTLRQNFDEQDGVVPVITRAVVSFAAVAGDPDTLRATLSEPTNHQLGSSWIRWGRPSRDSSGQAMAPIVTPGWMDRQVEYLVDTSFHATWGDSVRLGEWPLGGLSDAAGNRPSRFSHWTPIEFGDIAGRLIAMPWPAMVEYDGWTIPDNEPALKLFSRPTHGVWKTMEGLPPSQAASHYAGIRIVSNQDLESAMLYLYDNSGVFVAHVDLSPLLGWLRGNALAKTQRGDWEILVAWNGKDAHGRRVSSGAYLARLVVFTRSGFVRQVVHRTFWLGWKVPKP